MKKYMKRWICLMVICVAIMMNGTLTVRAAEQRVYDDAGLFTAEEVQKIEEKIESLKERIPYDVVIVTTDNAGGKDAMTYADDFYDDNGFGTGDDKSGVLLLIDMDNREIWISTCGEMIYILTDERIDKILDKVYIGVSAQDYNNAVRRFLNQTEDYVNPLPKALATGFFTGLVISGITCLIIVRRYRGKRTKEEYIYQREGDMRLVRQDDQFLNSVVTHRKIPKDPPQSQSRNSGGRSLGGSSTHVSNSGRTHGGGGRKF